MSRISKHLQIYAQNHMPIGVGLRHPHFKDALSETAGIDFLEVHAENFFAEGGLPRQILEAIAAQYPLSFHGTSMGLGSAGGVNQHYLERLKQVIEYFKPHWVSDHASFAWSTIHGRQVHMADLLPLPFNMSSLDILVANVDYVQQHLGRQLLIENIVVYLDIDTHEMHETEFLSRLVERTGCGLLVDLNNLLVNARNNIHQSPLSEAKQWLEAIPVAAVKEVHLAGYTEPKPDQLIIDDHSQPVSDECWALYQHALLHFDSFASLIEWDSELPSWQVLLNESKKASQHIEEHQATMEKQNEQQLCISA